MGRRRSARLQEDGAVEITEWRRPDRRRSSNGQLSQATPSSRRLGDQVLGGRNTTRKLMCREIGELRGRLPPRPDVNFCAEKFRRFKLQEEYFIHNDMPQYPLGTSITGITAAGDFIFVVASPGVCMAFHRNKNGSITPYTRHGQIWYFNNLDEWIELVFYNKINGSIIIVSSMWDGEDGYETRALPLESIRKCNHSDNGVRIFGDRSAMPIFCEDNNIALVRHNTTSTPVANVYEMNSYNLVHSFGSKNIIFVTSRPGMLIVAHMWTETYLPIEVLSTENWTVLKNMNYAVPPLGFEKISMCQDYILLKEKGRKMHIIDIWNEDNVKLIKQTRHQKLLSIYDLAEERLMLRYTKNIVVASCNSHDEHVALLEDNEVLDLDTYVTRHNNYAMVYSRKQIEKPGQDFYRIGSMNIYNIFNGESIWKISACDYEDLTIPTRKECDNSMTNTQSSTYEALEDVTTLFYDKEWHKIYTGNKKGFLHVWSN